MCYTKTQSLRQYVVQPPLISALHRPGIIYTNSSNNQVLLLYMLLADKTMTDDCFAAARSDIHKTKTANKA